MHHTLQGFCGIVVREQVKQVDRIPIRGLCFPAWFHRLWRGMLLCCWRPLDNTKLPAGDHLYCLSIICPLAYSLHRWAWWLCHFGLDLALSFGIDDNILRWPFKTSAPDYVLSSKNDCLIILDFFNNKLTWADRTTLSLWPSEVTNLMSKVYFLLLAHHQFTMLLIWVCRSSLGQWVVTVVLFHGWLPMPDRTQQSQSGPIPTQCQPAWLGFRWNMKTQETS